jgi:hypothetical protein
MNQLLSQLLISVLLLISPLSFSTDKVTNFTYECPVSAECNIKSKRTAVVRQSSPTVALHKTAASSQLIALPAPINPPAILHWITTHSRAPPA